MESSYIPPSFFPQNRERTEKYEEMLRAFASSSKRCPFEKGIKCGVHDKGICENCHDAHFAIPIMTASKMATDAVISMVEAQLKAGGFLQ